MTDASPEARRAERGSKLLVLALVGAFFFGMFGFAVAVLDARTDPEPTPPPPPSLPALPASLPEADAESPPDAETRRVLLAVADTLKQITQIIQSDPRVAEIKWLTGRNAGRYRFVEAGLRLRGKNRESIEHVIPRIEAAVRSAIPPSNDFWSR